MNKKFLTLACLFSFIFVLGLQGMEGNCNKVVKGGLAPIIFENKTEELFLIVLSFVGEKQTIHLLCLNKRLHKFIKNDLISKLKTNQQKLGNKISFDSLCRMHCGEEFFMNVCLSEQFCEIFSKKISELNKRYGETYEGIVDSVEDCKLAMLYLLCCSKMNLMQNIMLRKNFCKDIEPVDFILPPKAKIRGMEAIFEETGNFYSVLPGLSSVYYLIFERNSENVIFKKAVKFFIVNKTALFETIHNSIDADVNLYFWGSYYGLGDLNGIFSNMMYKFGDRESRAIIRKKMIKMAEGSGIPEILTKEDGIRFIANAFVRGDIRGKDGHFWHDSKLSCFRRMFYKNKDKIIFSFIKELMKFEAEVFLNSGFIFFTFLVFKTGFIKEVKFLYEKIKDSLNEKKFKNLILGAEKCQSIFIKNHGSRCSVPGGNKNHEKIIKFLHEEYEKKFRLVQESKVFCGDIGCVIS